MPALLVERFAEPFDHFLALAGLLGGIQRFVSPCVRHKKPPGCPGQPCRTGRKSPIAPDRQRHGRMARPWIVPGPVSFAAGFQIVPAEIRAHAMLRYQILFSNKLPAPITSARCTT